jgi:aminoglycoside/choline kinase family phosphotransferase
MSSVWRHLQESGIAEDLSLPWPVVEAVELQEHASTRSFYRLLGGGEAKPPTAVLVAYPADDRHEVERYQRTANWMRQAGVLVPEILAVGRRSLLVQDGGEHLLAEAELDVEALGDCYAQAAQIVASIQRHGRQVDPPNGDWALDSERLMFEMHFMEEHALRGWLGVDDRDRGRELLYERLVAEICELPFAACHRDFHARNLMVDPKGLLVLDFQDVMWGPQLYDLASLVWDNYCGVPDPVQELSLRQYWSETASEDLPISSAAAVPDIPRGLPPGARQAFCLVGLQRHLKALGTFGYQITRAGRGGYERYVAPTWRHARQAAVALEWDDFLTALSPFEQRVRGGLLE